MESFVVENKGVRLETKADGGRRVVAKQEFPDLYQVILRERPALVASKGDGMNDCDDYYGFLQSFHRVSSGTKALILEELCHPPVDGSFCIQRGLKTASQQLAPFTSLNKELLLKFLAVLAANTLEYNVSSDSTANVNTSGSDMPRGQAASAILLLASNIQHSCRPNLVFRAQAGDGALEYSVIRSIREGEPLSVSYIPHVLETPTYLRRAKLRQSRARDCGCPRCTQPDYSRTVTCPQCEKRQPCHVFHNGTSKEWICPDCGPQPVVTQTEQSLLIELDNSYALHVNSSPAPLFTVIHKVHTKLGSQTHWVAIQAWKELARLYATKAAHLDHLLANATQHASCSSSGNRHRKRELEAAQQKISEGLSLTQLRQQAFLSGVTATMALECLANQCTGCPVAKSQHEPCYHCSEIILRACQNLERIPGPQRPPYAHEMVHRYLPVLRGYFGGNQEEAMLKRMEETLVFFSSPSSSFRPCAHCGQAEPGQKILVCNRCKQVCYCNKDCQVKHWKTVHKVQCVALAMS